MNRSKIWVSVFATISFFVVGCSSFKGRSPDKLGYSSPRWVQEHISTTFKQFLNNVKSWDTGYLSEEAERFFSGCLNAKGWLDNWGNLTGRCMTTVDSGYIGCVGGVKYNPSVGPLGLTPDETQAMYKGAISKIIARWRENDALKDSDVDWIWHQPSVYVGCSINPFCEKFILDGDPADELAIEGPEGVGTFENIFVLACNLGTDIRPLEEFGGGAPQEEQQVMDVIP